MKRAISVTAGVLQLVLLAATGALLWLDKNSMGVMRFLANKNRVWSKAGWSGWLPLAAAGVMAALLVWAVVMLVSAKSRGRRRTWALLAMAAIAAGLFILIAGTAMLRAYYFICLILAAVAFLQAVKCMVISTTKQG